MSASPLPAHAPSDPTLAGRTVMVIEDHPDSRDLLGAVLQSLRARVIVAANVDEAQRKLAFAGANLIVCDMKLPDGSGLDFIKWLCAQSSVSGRRRALP